MSVKEQLSGVIRSINEFSKRTNMVAINAAIQASKLDNLQGAPFRVLADEIQAMSTQSIDKLGELDSLVNEISELSSLINLTGSQRMLLMKILNAKILDDDHMLVSAVNQFTGNLKTISKSAMNDERSERQFGRVTRAWDGIHDRLDVIETTDLCKAVNSLIEDINRLIKEFEQFAG